MSPRPDHRTNKPHDRPLAPELAEARPHTRFDEGRVLGLLGELVGKDHDPVAVVQVHQEFLAMLVQERLILPGHTIPPEPDAHGASLLKGYRQMKAQQEQESSVRRARPWAHERPCGIKDDTKRNPNLSRGIR